MNKRLKSSEMKSMSRNELIQSNDESSRIKRFFEIYPKKMYDIGWELSKRRDLKDKDRKRGEEMPNRGDSEGSGFFWKKMIKCYNFK